MILKRQKTETLFPKMHTTLYAVSSVIETFPYISSKISKKKDANKADAILIARFFHETNGNS